MVAMWVILDRRQALVMFIFTVVESSVEDQIPISVLMTFMTLSQLISRLSRFPFRYIPSSLKGSVSQVTLVFFTDVRGVDGVAKQGIFCFGDIGFQT